MSLKKNMLMILMDRLIKMAIIFFMGVIIARTLGAEKFGVFAYANSLLAVFLVVSSGGIESFAARELAKSTANDRVLVRNVIGVRLLFAVPVVLLTWAASWYGLLHFSDYLVVALMLATVVSVLNVTELYFQSKSRGDLLLVLTFCVAVPGFIFKCYVLATRGIVAEKYLLDSVEALLLFCATLFLVYRLRPAAVVPGQPPELVLGVWEMMRRSFPLWMNGILLTLYTRADQLVIGKFLGEKSLGEYAVAIQISSIVLVVPAVIMTAVFPKLVRARADDPLRYKEILAVCTQVMIVMFGFWLLFVVVAGKLLLRTVYGSPFAVSYDYLLIYSFGVLFICLGSVAGQWAVVEGQFWLSFWRSFFGLSLNLALNWLLIGKYGAIGCAWAAVVSLAVTNFFLYGVFPNGREIFILQLRAVVALFSKSGLKSFITNVHT